MSTEIIFKKFPSLENTYRTKEIEQIELNGYANEKYIVTEKVHGANFSFHVYREVDTIQIKCAKRTGFIEDGERFFNYKPVLEKYREALTNLHNDVLDEDYILYGELFGGNIQSGVCYSLEQDFVAFDIHIKCASGFVPLNKMNVFGSLLNTGFNVVPVIGVYDTLHEALEVDESFTSLLIRDDFDGVEEHKEAEGVVIEPIIPRWFPSGSRVYLKKKTKRFSEKSGKPSVKKTTQEQLPKELECVLEEAYSYITEPRFNAVCSKIGEVTIKDIGKVMGLMTQDILVDMGKDEVLVPDNKRFMKLLQTQVQNFIRPILLCK